MKNRRYREDSECRPGLNISPDDHNSPDCKIRLCLPCRSIRKRMQHPLMLGVMQRSLLLNITVESIRVSMNIVDTI